MLEVNINFKKYLNILNEKMTAQRMERFLKDKGTPNSNLIKILIFVIFLFAIIRFFLKTRIVEFIFCLFQKQWNFVICRHWEWIQSTKMVTWKIKISKYQDISVSNQREQYFVNYATILISSCMHALMHQDMQEEGREERCVKDTLPTRWKRRL